MTNADLQRRDAPMPSSSLRFAAEFVCVVVGCRAFPDRRRRRHCCCPVEHGNCKCDFVSVSVNVSVKL